MIKSFINDQIATAFWLIDTFGLTVDWSLIILRNVINVENVKGLIERGLNSHADREFAFRYNCMIGNLTVAQFLYQTGLTIDYNFFFDNVYYNGHYHICDWLLTLTDRGYVYSWRSFQYQISKGVNFYVAPYSMRRSAMSRYPLERAYST